MTWWTGGRRMRVAVPGLAAGGEGEMRGTKELLEFANECTLLSVCGIGRGRHCRRYTQRLLSRALAGFGERQR